MDVRPYHSGRIRHMSERRSFSVTELEMIQRPVSVGEIIRLFKTAPVVLWMGSENRFICREPSMVVIPNGYTFELQWSVFNKDKMKVELPLYVFSETLQGLSYCLDCLSELAMWSGSEVALRPGYRAGMFLCPLSPELLGRFVSQNQERICEFSNMTFTPPQCEALATSGTSTHLVFHGCRFQDQGEAFANAHATNDHNAGPTKLDFRYKMAINATRLIACLPKLQELSLYCTGSVSSELGQALVSAPLDHLELISGDVWLTDDAQEILLSNIREGGRGPKGISVHSDTFGSREKFVRFCEALSHENGRRYLKKLEICNADATSSELDPQAETALLAALRENLELTSFSLTYFDIRIAFWHSLLNQVSLQPSLKELDISGLLILSDPMTFTERTEQLADTILANKNIEQVESSCCRFDPEVWKKRVRPALEHNEHRERFAAVEKTIVSHTRNALLAEALQKVNSRPSLVFALLQRNVDVIMDVIHDSAFASAN